MKKEIDVIIQELREKYNADPRVRLLIFPAEKLFYSKASAAVIAHELADWVEGPVEHEPSQNREAGWYCVIGKEVDAELVVFYEAEPELGEEEK
jgi:hypothetical protein